MQIPLFCPLIDLLEEGTAVVPPEGMVFSCAPRKAAAKDGYSYFVKGPDRNIVVAEAVAYQLAQSLGLVVPEFGIALPENGSGPLFASREVARCHRQVEPWIRRERTINRNMLPAVAAFDVLLMNKDRNINNLVGEVQLAPHEGTIVVVAIDFEKSMALRGPYPLTTTPHIPPRTLRPSGTLGQLVTGDICPNEFYAALEAIREGHVLDAFARVEARLNEDIPWKGNSAQLIARRATRIRDLVAEVWR